MPEVSSLKKWMFLKPLSIALSPFFFLFLIQPLAGFSGALAQEVKMDTITETVSTELNRAPFVYIDCRDCDYNFIRTELTFVNYVRDPEMADIHVFVTEEETGGGGRE